MAPTISAILIVEDSARDAEAFTVLLRSMGILNPIVSVNDGARAIAYFRGDGEFADRTKFPFPGVVLLDLRMPGMDGFDVLEWLRDKEHLKQMLVVALSAYDGVREVTHAYALGAKSFLLKPCGQADLENLIKSYPDHWVRAAGHSESQRPSASV
jgi:CheY-like chemotaxis protein